MQQGDSNCNGERIKSVGSKSREREGVDHMGQIEYLYGRDAEKTR
jgi:hypothetical protein